LLSPRSLLSLKAYRAIVRIQSDLNKLRSFSDLEIKAKINQWYLIKLSSFCTARETIKKKKQNTTPKRQPTEWEKTVSNDATDKGLISKITNNLYNSTAKNPTTQLKNGQKT